MNSKGNKFISKKLNIEDALQNKFKTSKKIKKVTVKKRSMSVNLSNQASTNE